MKVPPIFLVKAEPVAKKDDATATHHVQQCINYILMNWWGEVGFPFFAFEHFIPNNIDDQKREGSN